METEQQSPMMLPLLKFGFCFSPTQQQLALYLQRKVDDLSLLPSHITGFFHHRDDVYGDKDGNHEPWNLFDVKNNNTGQYFYVITQLKKVSDNSKRINRRAGTGTWNCRTKSRDVKDFDGKVIGFNKYYIFEVKGGGVDGSSRSRIQHGKWTMHEFCLNERQCPGDVVMCVIGCDTTISIRDDPISSVAFAKYFENEQNNVKFSGSLETSKKSEKRKLMESSEDDEQHNSRKRTRFSSVDDALSGFIVDQQFLVAECTVDQQRGSGVEESSSSSVSDYELCDFDYTEGNLFGNQFLSIPDDSGNRESSHNAFQEPEILLPDSTILPFSMSAAEEIEQQVDPSHTETHPFFSDSLLCDYDFTSGTLFADQFLRIPNEIILESSLSVFEEPSIPLPLYHSTTVQPCSISVVEPVVAEERQCQLNEAMDGADKSTAETGIPMESYLQLHCLLTDF